MRHYHAKNSPGNRGSIFRWDARSATRRVAEQPDRHENLSAFFHYDATPYEALERMQRPVIFRCNKTNRVADGVCAAGPPDAMKT